METAKTTLLLTDLPLEIIAKILSKAASNSAEDYANAVLSCKDAWMASKTFMIFKDVSLAKIEPLPWLKPEVELFRRCVEEGNIEALFRMGLETFFGKMICDDDALSYLEKSYKGGCLPAGYMFGLILVFCLGPSRMEEGLGVLSSLKIESEPNPRLLVWKCRATGAGILRKLWGVLPFWVPIEDIDCQQCKRCTTHAITKDVGVLWPLPDGWWKPDFKDYDHPMTWWLHVLQPDPLDGVCCERCFWIKEAKFFFAYVSCICKYDLEPLFAL